MGEKSLFRNVLLIVSLIFLSSTWFSISTFAEEVNDLNASNYTNDNFENSTTNIEINNQIITPFSKPYSKAKVDWGGLLGRSVFSNQSGSTRIYHNSGNYTTARAELNRIGGNGEIVTHINGDKITYVKQTDGGYVTLYRSTSETLGNQRPTLTFGNDKVRFMGD